MEYLSLSDFKEAWSQLSTNYTKNTPAKIKMVDQFIGFNAVLSLFQFIYFFFISRNPFEPFLSGIFCTTGLCVFTIALRILLAQNSEKEGRKKVLAEYLFACFLLYFATFTYML